MRQIGTLETETQASRFADYLVAKGIQLTLEPDDGRFAIWVHQEDHIAEARRDFAEFVANPDDPRYAAAAATAEEVRQAAFQKLRAARKTVVNMRDRWDAPPAARAPLTYFLIAISVMAAFGTRLDGDSPLAQRLKIATPGRPTRWPDLSEVRKGEVWRLVTPIFVHMTITHIFFNMLWLQSLGAMIESQRGTGRFLGMVLLIAVTSNLAQYALKSPNFGGMSGVVFGLFGYVWMKSRYEPDSGMFIDQNSVMWMIAWLVICTMGWVGPVANTAHAVGLAVGMLLGYRRTFLRQLLGQ